MNLNSPVSLESIYKFNTDDPFWGASPLSYEESEYANEISNVLNGPGAYPILDNEAWKDLNRQQNEILTQEEMNGMLLKDLENIAKGFTTTKDVEKRAAAYSVLRANLMAKQLTSAAALSAARQMGAEAMIDNPSLTATGMDQARRMEFFAGKDAVLENHIKMAQTNLDNASWWTKTKGFIGNIIAFPGLFDVYSKQEAMKALDRGDAEWFDRSDNMELFYQMVMTAHQDNRLSPEAFDRFLDILDEKMAKAGVNPYQTSVLYDYLNEHDRGTQTTGMILDYGTLIGGGLLKGAAGATKAVAAVKAVKGTSKAAKAAAGIWGGLKGVVIGSAGSVPFGEVPGKAATITAEFLLKGTSSKLSRLGRLINVGNKKLARDEVLKILESAPQITSTEAKKSIWNNAVMNLAKPVKYNSDDYIGAEKLIQSEKAQLAMTQKWIQAFNSSAQLDQIKGDLWKTEANKIAKAVEDSGYVEQIIPSQAGFRDIVDAVQPIAQKDGSIVARVKLDMLPEAAEQMKSQMKTTKFVNESGQLAFEFGEDEAREVAKNVAALIAKSTKDLTGYGTKVVPYLDNGVWKLQAEIATKKGWGTLYREAHPVKKSAEKFRSFMSSFFTVTSNPTDIQQLNIARALSASPIQATKDAVMKSFNALGSEDKELLENIIQTSIHYQAFYTPEHLLSRGISQAVVDTYSKWRAFNDLDYYIRNKATREYLESLGLKDLKFNGAYVGRGRVFPVNELSEFRAKIMGANGQAGRKFLLVDSNDPKDLQEISDIAGLDAKIKAWYSQGYRIVENLHGPDEFHDASQVLHLYKGNGLVEEDLPEFVTSYVAGGRRFFDRSGGFVKQIQLEKNMNNRDVITGVKTFGADRDFVGLQRRVDIIEQIRKAYVKENYAEVDRLIAESGLPLERFSDSASFGEWANGLGIDLEHLDNALEVVKDGSLLNSYDKLVKAGAFDTLGPDEMYNLVHRSSFQALTNEAKMAKLRRTGRELFTWDLSDAVPVDFEHQMRYMVDDMVHTGIMPQFTDFYAERFAKDFSTVIQHSAEMSAKEMLERGAIKEGLTGANAELAKAAQTAQLNYKAIKGIPSEFDKRIAGTLDTALGFVADKTQKWFKINEDLAHGVRVNWSKVQEFDPLNFGRTVTSQWYLGLGNVSQLYKQWASDFAVWAMDPKAAAYSSKYHLPFTIALWKSDGNLFKAINQLSTKFGDSPAAVRKDFENLIKMGAFTHGTAGGFAEAGQTVGSMFNKISYAPFNFGEMANRTKAYLAALYSKGYHGQDLSAAQLAEVTDYAQRLFLQMDATGLSRIQTGTFGKTFMQYMGYRMRWLETVLFDRELTGAQRARLAIANAALVGGEGMLGMGAYNAVSNIFAEDDHPQMDPDEDYSELKNLAAQGILNWAADKTGLDVNFGNVLDLSYGDMADDLLLAGKFDIPMVSFTSKALQFTVDTFKEVNRMFYDEYTPEDFSNFLQIMSRSGELPASFAKPYLGYMAWKTGKEFNSRGQLTSEDNTTLQAFLKGIGFTSLNANDVYRARLQEQSYNKRVSDFKKEVQQAYNQTLINPTEVNKAYLSFLVKTAPFTSQVRGKVLQEVIKGGVKDQGNTLLQQVIKNQMKRHGIGGNKEYLEYINDFNQLREGEQ